jgi:hypothetical protein
MATGSIPPGKCSPDGVFLESDEGRRAIVALHVEGIVNYVLKR